MLLKELGVIYPIIQAPMAGGDTPELVAAVSNAGGLGSLGAAYLDPSQIARDIRRIRLLTDKPFGVNLFAGGYEQPMAADQGPMLAVMQEIHQALGLPPPTPPPAFPKDPFDDQLQAVLEERPTVFSFTFGVPSRDALARLKSRGIAMMGTATTAAEATILEEAGVMAIVAQGAEAGAHRGTFAGSFETCMVPVLELVSQIQAATTTPIIASGGLMHGSDIAACLARGAAVAQLGTAFLTCPESGVSESYKTAILSARTDTTVVTRAFSGRPARGLTNAFILRLQGREEIVLPYPLQNILTRPMRKAAAELGHAGYQSLWAGQGVTRARAMPAAQLVNQLVAEMTAAGQTSGGSFARSSQ
jgi:nitronate monooxygenase